ncbi:hypothetical protein DL766_000174 [Monosporascus sp. MC13-8B]|uniref:Uncharacterized protein n=1 Tax=Monosporascus cannonballus TaxID=155416 RepID=A0ABY0HH31_9PEZI|nr:hypothetical protein DL762_001622 [Monosporascus cannonballus]RYP01540.1 hypothetical protein DL763_000071 [Monosporascus cannonballus]RYP39965.1 hypothetical protein DL766_000174 [Monosporascus sp. MC13-8B]
MRQLMSCDSTTTGRIIVHRVSLPFPPRNEAADAVALKGWTMSNYEGSVEYWVLDVDEIKKALTIDLDWVGKVAVPEEDIGDKHRGLVQVSLDNGKSAFSAVKSS